jgi:hypothetical protein
VSAGATAPDLPRTLRAGLVAAAAVLLLALLVHHGRVAGQRHLDTDELEHLNAACFVARGETLYRSFYENHPPLTTLLLQPVVRSTDDPATLVARGRQLSLAASLATLALVAYLGWRLAGGGGAALAPLLLASHTFFSQRAIEVRPDVPAMLLGTLALLALIGGQERDDRRWLLAAGALFALAGFFTPKVVYAAAGASLGATLAARARAGRTRRATGLGVLAWIVLGAGLVTAALALEMARRGMLMGFVQDCLVVSARMQIDDPWGTRLALLARTLRENPATWGLALAGLAWFARERSPASAVLGLALVGGLAGFLHVRAPLVQFHLTFLPALALAAASGGTLLLARAVRRGGLAAGWWAIFLGLGACLAPPAPALLAEKATLAPQLQVIDKVRELVGERERVLDCWSGLYLTRLPAYRYFYLNSDLLRLLDPQTLERELHSRLDDPSVRLVIVWRHYRILPASVRTRIEREFEPVKGFPMLLVRPPGDVR